MEDNIKKLGTFDGVYVPTVLTILGVIMYLRLGWVVGNAGFIGTLIIIIIAHIITYSTVFSMSSIISNFKIEDGGAYTIICHSLGLEWGGAIGIPLYLSQSFSVAFYIIGFVEVWVGYFPNSNFRLVSFLVWIVLFAISYLSAKLAFKIQYGIFAAVIISIFTFVFGPSINSNGIVLMGKFGEAGFWETFAIFFPAVTGILAGVTMSGELKTPRKSIIKGTIAAVNTGFVVYIFMAFWFSHQADQGSLISNSTVILDLSYVPIFIVAGIMGAILSSALSTLVGAPRTLNALAQNRAVPFSDFLSKKAKNGEPRNAIMISSLISLAILLGSNLDALAEILTLFFLTTYGMINLVVFLEKVSGIKSFRPTLAIPKIIPVIGFLGSMFAMILINKYFTIITFIIIILIYALLKKKHLESPWGDVRGGLFTMFAEWGAQKAMSLPYTPRLWKPSILIPVEKAEDYNRMSHVIRDIIFPSGRLYYLTIKDSEISKEEIEEIENNIVSMKNEHIFADKIVIKNGDFDRDFSIIMQSLQQTFLPPNAVLFTISSNKEKNQRLNSIISQIKHSNVGIICMRIHPEFEFGNKKTINLWLREKSPNFNLAILIAMQLKNNWNCKLNLIRVIYDKDKETQVKKELEELIDDARLPADTNTKVYVGNFNHYINKERADVTILGLPPKYLEILEIYKNINGSVLFIGDSGLENVLA